MMLLAYVRSRFFTSHETSGSPRKTVEINEVGVTVVRHRVARLIRKFGLKAIHKTRFKETTDIVHSGPVPSSMLEQDFEATGPIQKWGMGIIYTWMAEGRLYFAIVLDLYSRRIVG